MKKILILLVNPTDTVKLRLDQEVREIEAALQRSSYRDQYEIKSKGAVRVDDLRRAILDHGPTILHFSGHGTSNGLIFENETGQQQMVAIEPLAKLFKLFQDEIECVILNACYSEPQAQAIHQYIDCVIGMGQSIGDEAAIKFATGFYDALGAGQSYQRCFDIACSAIDLSGIPEANTPKIKIRHRDIADRKITEKESEKTLPANTAPSGSVSSLVTNITGGNLSHLQIEQVGRDVNQNQEIGAGETKPRLTVNDVKQLMGKIAKILENSDLPEASWKKALKYLESAQEEIVENQDQLDQEYVAKNLQRVVKTIKEATENMDTESEIITRLSTIFEKLEVWLEIPIGNLGK